MSSAARLPVGSHSDRVVVITGAGSGLGRAAAVLFAQRGARVMGVDIEYEAAAKTARELQGNEHCVLSADISVESAAQGVATAAIDRYGRIDVLVNSAGIAEGKSPTLDRDLNHWQRIIDVNLTGSYLMCHSIARKMRDTGGGAILNLSSIAGVIGLPQRTAYSASKGAVSMMTRVLATEWAPYGIRVNAVAPGYIRTPMTERLMAEGRLKADAILRRSPTGQLGTPEDVAEALAFLASDQARFITGTVVPVDGAYTANGGPEDAYPGVLSNSSDIHPSICERSS